MMAIWRFSQGLFRRTVRRNRWAAGRANGRVSTIHLRPRCSDLDGFETRFWLAFDEQKYNFRTWSVAFLCYVTIEQMLLLKR